MTAADDPQLSGYWWECRANPRHHGDTDHTRGMGLTAFMFALAARDWDQTFLTAPCAKCDGSMDLTYAFPRKIAPSRLVVHHIVGLTDHVESVGYLPMIWEAQAKDEETPPWFDFKYVGRDERGRLQAYGLARPAVFSREDLAKLFATYHRVTGQPVLP